MAVLKAPIAPAFAARSARVKDPTTFGDRPNVQGSCHFLRYNGADDLDSVIKNGAFTLTVSYRDTAKQNGAVFGSTLFNFNAGNSNAIYGKANNVRVSSAQFLMNFGTRTKNTIAF